MMIKVNNLILTKSIEAKWGRGQAQKPKLGNLIENSYSEK